MTSSNDKKDGNRKRSQAFRKRFVESSGPEFLQLIADYRHLSENEQKRFSEEKDRIAEFIKLGLDEYLKGMDVETISSDFSDYKKFLKRLHAEIDLAEAYLTKHSEIPDNIRTPLWRFYHIGSPEMRDMLAFD